MKHTKSLTLIALALAGSMFVSPRVLADETSPAAGGKSTEELAKVAQNPVANMISVPFQNNFNFGIGPNKATQYILNFQPVIPISLNDNWNLITRMIMPIINQPSPAPGFRSAFGLGDINPDLLPLARRLQQADLGCGAHHDAADRDRFHARHRRMVPAGPARWWRSPCQAIGSSALWSTTSGRWPAGATQNLNNFLLQPFVNYNLPHGWYLTSSPILTANWDAEHRDMWTVPVGGGIGRS